jgi:hypothetical protein
MWVGNVFSGTLNIDGTGTSVTSNRLIVIGYGNNLTSVPARVGTVNITNGGSLVSTVGNINLGEGTGGSPNGVQGRLVVSGATSAVSVISGGADLVVGVHNATSSVTQSGGTISVNDRIEIAPYTTLNTNVNTNSFYAISGGSTTTGNSFLVGGGTSVGAALNVSGGSLQVGARLLVGTGAASGAVVNQSGGVVATTQDIRLGDVGTAGGKYNLSGGTINATTGGIVGRQGTSQFLQTGGTANFNGTLSIGNRETETLANSGLYKISGGDLNITNALNVATSGIGEFRVVGDDSTIDVVGSMTVNNTANGVGTLAFELEASDVLATIGVTNIVTFSAGSKLILDASNAAPTQSVYNLVTAASIVDNGIVFTAPAGWGYRIITSGIAQQTLQAFLPVPEPGAAGLALAAAIMVVRRRRN